MSFMLLGILNSQAAGGAGIVQAFDLLDSETLSTTASSVTFSGLGAYSDYKHLQIRIIAKSTVASSNQNINLNFNGDTGANYSTRDMEGNGSSIGYGISTGITSIRVAQHAGTTVPDTWAGAVVDILDFSSSSKATTTRTLNGWASANTPRVFVRNGLWTNTAAVTSMVLTDGGGGYTAGTRFAIYGIKGA